MSHLPALRPVAFDAAAHRAAARRRRRGWAAEVVAVACVLAPLFALIALRGG